MKKGKNQLTSEGYYSYLKEIQKGRKWEGKMEDKKKKKALCYFQMCQEKIDFD